MPPRQTPDETGTSGPDDRARDEIEDAVVLGETPAQDERRVIADLEAEPDGPAPTEADRPPADLEEPRPEPDFGQPAAESAAEDEQDRLREPQSEPEASSPEEVPAEARAEVEAAPVVAPPPPRRSGLAGALLLVLGGVIAAGLGFGASRYVFPEGWPGQGAATESALADLRTADAALRETDAGQTARLDEIAATIAALRDEVSAIEDPAPAIAALQGELEGGLAGALGQVETSAAEAAAETQALAQRIGELSDRVEALALRPVPEAVAPERLDEELQAFQAELRAAVEAAREEMRQAEAQAEALAAEAARAAEAEQARAAEEAAALRQAAEAEAAAAARRAAVARLVATVESGEPYADELAALDEPVPVPLLNAADTGVPSLAALQERFPEAARRALDASIRGGMGESPVDRFSAFLRVQTGARSLEPRAGDDPDAVLSRAEAAVRAGDLAAALAEIEALPEAGRAEMAGWIDAAQTRRAVLDAARDLNPN